MHTPFHELEKCCQLESVARFDDFLATLIKTKQTNKKSLTANLAIVPNRRSPLLPMTNLITSSGSTCLPSESIPSRHLGAIRYCSVLRFLFAFLNTRPWGNLQYRLYMMSPIYKTILSFISGASCSTVQGAGCIPADLADCPPFFSSFSCPLERDMTSRNTQR